MKCNGIVIYKGIEERAGGTFKNAQGQEINYDSSYVIKFDENKDGKINERKLKFPASNKALFDKFKVFGSYTTVELICDVVFGQSTCKLVPIDVIKK